MPYFQYSLLKVPPLLLGLILIIISIIFSITGLLVVRRFIKPQKLKIHNDVAGPIFATLGVIYAVLLAFLVVIIWQNFDRANLNVDDEANCLVDLYTDCECFSGPFKQQIRALCSDYAKTMINEEWKMMAEGKESSYAKEIVRKMWILYSGYSPKSQTEQAFFEESIHKLNELCELRRMRLLESRHGIHPMLWFVLIIGGIITIVFTFFFGSENLEAQIIMTTLLSVLIALALFTILEFDFPFAGRVSISPEAFERMLNF